MRMWRSESVLALIGSCLLILFVSSGRVSAGDAMNAVPGRPQLAAPYDLTDCAQTAQGCKGVCSFATQPGRRLGLWSSLAMG